MLLVAGDSKQSVDAHLGEALAVLDGTVKEVLNLSGQVRPGKEEGHEQ